MANMQDKSTLNALPKPLYAYMKLLPMGVPLWPGK